MTGFPSGSVVKNPLVSGRNAGDVGLIPGMERSHEGGNGNPLQYSCLVNSMDRGAWQATVHGVTNRHDWLTHTHCAHNISRHHAKIFTHIIPLNLALITDKETAAQRTSFNCLMPNF